MGILVFGAGIAQGDLQPLVGVAIAVFVVPRARPIDIEVGGDLRVHPCGVGVGGLGLVPRGGAGLPEAVDPERDLRVRSQFQRSLVPIGEHLPVAAVAAEHVVDEPVLVLEVIGEAVGDLVVAVVEITLHPIKVARAAGGLHSGLEARRRRVADVLDQAAGRIATAQRGGGAAPPPARRRKTARARRGEVKRLKQAVRKSCSCQSGRVVCRAYSEGAVYTISWNPLHCEKNSQNPGKGQCYSSQS